LRRFIVKFERDDPLPYPALIRQGRAQTGQYRRQFGTATGGLMDYGTAPLAPWRMEWLHGRVAGGTQPDASPATSSASRWIDEIHERVAELRHCGKNRHALRPFVERWYRSMRRAPALDPLPADPVRCGTLR
jgi:hypothetical protein